MMLRLYKFTCPGNYPVCPAVVIFATTEYLTWETSQGYCAGIADDLAIENFQDCKGLEYLGTFMPHDEVTDLPYIIHSENGEY